MKIKIMTFLSVLFLPLFLVSCGGDRSLPEHYEKAYKLCSSNGGVDYWTIHELDYPFIRVICNNSATFNNVKFLPNVSE